MRTLDCFLSLVYPVLQLMLNSEIRKLLLQVISSWQVLVVTGVLVFYILIVNNVARLYHRRRPQAMPKAKKFKPAKIEDPASSASGQD
jgi:ABC-type transport system involved in cytochrome bd biosynthesis fused ATPase/permease subunit